MVEKVIKFLVALVFLFGFELLLVLILGQNGITKDIYTCMTQSVCGGNYFVITFIAFIINILLAFVFASTGATQTYPAWKEDVKTRLAQIQSSYSSDDPTKLKMALIEVDKILDFSLKMRGFKGKTMGERLKSAKNFYEKKEYNLAWEGHKLRNRIVHEVGMEFSKEEIKLAFWNLRAAVVKLIG